MYFVAGIQGAWRTVLERMKDFRQKSSEAELLSNAAWYILALSKLRMYTACAEELALLGPLDAQHYAEPTPHGATHLNSVFCCGKQHCQLQRGAGHVCLSCTLPRWQGLS